MLALLGSLKKAGVTPPPDPNLITNSLRFRRAASANLTRTFSTPTNASVYTWSGWVKRGNLGVTARLFGASTTTSFGFNSADQLLLTLSGTTAITTTAIFRDPSAWYHIVYAQNEAAQTIYVNGSPVGTGTTASTVFNTAIAHQLGAANTANYFDGYLTEINFIDGQALTPTSFGQIDSITGVWSPKQYVGSYGNNGFRLRFNSTSSLPALTADSSGNNNNWTATNVSLTSGVTYDSMIDVPINYSDGQNGRGNYAVINSYNPITTATLVSGNLETTSAASPVIVGNISIDSGSWYWEMQYSSATLDQLVGVYKTSATIASITPTTNVIGVRFNADTGDLDYTVDGATYTSIATGLTGGGYVPYAASATNAKIIYANFGQRPFAYTRHVGFNALNTDNLPNPVIANPANYIAATTYTGTSNLQSISNEINGASFQPDLVWIKSRTPAATNHALFDSVRGVARYLSSNSTNTETINADTLTAFNANGFSLGIDNTLVNANANSYIAWQWKRAIISGLDVVSYTGTGANALIPHNLGVIPKAIIVKRVSAGASTNWPFYHSSLADQTTQYLNLTSLQTPASTTWNARPTLSGFNIGTSADVNLIGQNYIAYCFAEISGFSKFGIYEGNNIINGPFVFCGFTPKFIIIKNMLSPGAGFQWFTLDSGRNTINDVNFPLQLDTANAEYISPANGTNSAIVRFYSNGFKVLTFNSSSTNSRTLAFFAFAETPFKYALAKF
jgi:hypothetical protein